MKQTENSKGLLHGRTNSHSTHLLVVLGGISATSEVGAALESGLLIGINSYHILIGIFIGLLAIVVVSLNHTLRQSKHTRVTYGILHKRWEFALESSNIGVWDWNITEDQSYFSPAMFRILGYPEGNYDDKWRLSLFHPDDIPQTRYLMQQLLENQSQSYVNEQRMKHADGSWRWILEHGKTVDFDNHGRARRYISTFNDITEQKRSEDKLRHIANHDSLTGLPNRNQLRTLTDAAIRRAHAQGRSVALIFLDIDHFKRINDSLGHNTGDTLLIAIVGRLLALLRKNDIVSRQGGDEFVLLMPEVGSRQEVSALCNRLQQEIRRPIYLQSQEIEISASFGIAMYPTDGSDFDTLVRKSDIALYKVKRDGRNGHRFYSDDLNIELTDRNQMDKKLRQALRDERLIMWYHPQYDLKTMQLIGAEALIRWIEPDGSKVLPNDFIPVAEEFGHIHEIGILAVRLACEQARRWMDLTGRTIPVAVNLSPIQFRRPELVDSVKEVVLRSGLPRHALVLEITESTLMADEVLTSQALNDLSSFGIRLAIDDFGTGYSSLAYLKRLKVNHLKIDRTFVKDLGDDPDDAVIVQTILQLGHSFKLDVIAEGVETEEQLQILRKLNCEYGQGYYFSEPLPPDAFIEHLLNADKKNISNNSPLKMISDNVVIPFIKQVDQ